MVGVSTHVENLSAIKFVAPDIHLTHLTNEGFVGAKVTAQNVLFLTECKQTTGGNCLSCDVRIA